MRQPTSTPDVLRPRAPLSYAARQTNAAARPILSRGASNRFADYGDEYLDYFLSVFKEGSYEEAVFQKDLFLQRVFLGFGGHEPPIIWLLVFARLGEEVGTDGESSALGRG
jgi:hypothetical protein